MTKLQAIILETIPFDENGKGYSGQWITIAGIKHHHFCEQGEPSQVILSIPDDELKKEVSFLIRNGFVKYVGNGGTCRQSRYTRSK